VGTDRTAEIDTATIRRMCHRALWDPTPAGEDLLTLIKEVEGYVRELSPKVAALVPRMRGETQGAARVALQHVDELLDESVPSADASTRLHDLGVVTRALLTLFEQCREPAPSEEEPSDVGGWLLVVLPEDS
jgi:hypothetical protein